MDIEAALLDLLEDEGYEPKEVEFIEDPKVTNVWAVRVIRERMADFDCIINLTDKTIDEVEFNEWPPRSGNLTFFL